MAREKDPFWREYDRLIEALWNQDLVTCEAALAREDTQTNRRGYCRALFALIEGHIAMLQVYVLTNALGIIGEDTELRLRNLRSILWGKSRGQTRPSFDKLADRVFFAQDTYAWTSGCFEFEERTPKADWRRLEKAASVRNRITHPKSARDLRISNRDLAMMRAVERWFLRRLGTLFVRVGTRQLRQAAAMLSALKKGFRT